MVARNSLPAAGSQPNIVGASFAWSLVLRRGTFPFGLSMAAQSLGLPFKRASAQKRWLLHGGKPQSFSEPHAGAYFGSAA